MYLYMHIFRYLCKNLHACEDTTQSVYQYSCKHSIIIVQSWRQTACIHGCMSVCMHIFTQVLLIDDCTQQLWVLGGKICPFVCHMALGAHVHDAF